MTGYVTLGIPDRPGTQFYLRTVETTLAYFATSKLGESPLNRTSARRLLAVAQEQQTRKLPIRRGQGRSGSEILIRRGRASQEQTPGK